MLVSRWRRRKLRGKDLSFVKWYEQESRTSWKINEKGLKGNKGNKRVLDERITRIEGIDLMGNKGNEWIIDERITRIEKRNTRTERVHFEN